MQNQPQVKTFHHSRKGIIHAEIISQDSEWMKLKIFNHVKGAVNDWQPGETIDVRKSFVKEVITEPLKNLLDLSIEALDASKPTYAHYPEPVERHKTALDGLKKMRTRLKTNYVSVEEFLENGGVLTQFREIFSIDKDMSMKFIGTYSYTDSTQNCLILSDSSKSFPISFSFSYVKIQTIPLYV